MAQADQRNYCYPALPVALKVFWKDFGKVWECAGSLAVALFINRMALTGLLFPLRIVSLSISFFTKTPEIAYTYQGKRRCLKDLFWAGRTAWSVRPPVTGKIAGSNPVRPANWQNRTVLLLR